MVDDRYRADEPTEAGESAPASPEDLAQRFRRRIVVMALRRLGDVAAAEDVAQETLLRVLEALREDRVEDLEALPAFVYQTARNICLQHGRKWTRRERAYGRWDRQARQQTEPVGLTDLVTGEDRAAVRRALERLEEGDRELLRMVYYEELDARALAVRLSVTPGALRVRKHRALQRLGRLLRREPPL